MHEYVHMCVKVGVWARKWEGEREKEEREREVRDRERAPTKG